MIQNPKRKLTELVQDLATLMFWWNSQEEGRGDNRDEGGKEETVFENTSPGIITQLWAPTSSCKHIGICLQRAVKPMRRFHWTWKACPKLPLTISRTFNTYSQASWRTENFKWKQEKNTRHKQQFFERKTNIVTKIENEEDKKTQGDLILGPTLEPWLAKNSQQHYLNELSTRIIGVWFFF